MELNRWIIKDGVCVVKKILPSIKTGNTLLKDKVILDALYIFYNNLGIKKGTLQPDTISKSDQSELKQELLKLIKGISKADPKLLSFDGKNIKITKEVNDSLKSKTDYYYLFKK